MTTTPVCVISDTSPLSAMSKMDWLPWLGERWGKVMVPEEVWRELLNIGDAAAFARLESAMKSGLIDVAVAPPLSRPGLAHLHSGEVAAISLALQHRAKWLIVDDGDARKAAKALGLRIIGVLGLVVWAKRRGHLQRVAVAIEELRNRTGFRLSPEVVQLILRDLGEESQPAG